MNFIKDFILILNIFDIFNFYYVIRRTNYKKVLDYMHIINYSTYKYNSVLTTIPRIDSSYYFNEFYKYYLQIIMPTIFRFNF